MLLVELGGGDRPKGPEWVNVDKHPSSKVRFVCDFENDLLPFGDDSVDSIYSSHCLEHISPYNHLLHEIVRVCKVGASVEIRVPHWLSSMANCGGHKQTISEKQIRHWCEDFIQDWWSGCKKRLRLTGRELIPGSSFEDGKRLQPEWSREDLLCFFPDACHEIRFFFVVVENT